MQDVAEHVGMSRQLVSLVLRGVPGPSARSRDRILSAAEELGYRANNSARLLRQNRTKLIGVVFSMSHPFQGRVVEAMFAKAEELGYALALGPLTAERSLEVAVTELMEERVEALAVFNPDPASPALRKAAKLVPVVLLGEILDVPGLDNVHVDEDQGLSLAVEHLVSLGHSDIAYAGGIGWKAGPARADAYRRAMAHFSLEAHEWVVPSDFTEEGGASAARILLEGDRLPTAVICAGDQCAVGLLSVFVRAGVDVPGEVSVVGFDDSYVAALSYNQMTSVHQDVDATVEATLSSVLAQIEGGEWERRRVLTPSGLTVRKTTGKARSSSEPR